MPFRTPQYPWLKIDHRNGSITCTRCKTTVEISNITGLEGLIDTLRPFARQHAKCPEAKHE